MAAEWREWSDGARTCRPKGIRASTWTEPRPRTPPCPKFPEEYPSPAPTRFHSTRQRLPAPGRWPSTVSPDHPRQKQNCKGSPLGSTEQVFSCFLTQRFIGDLVVKL